MGLQAALAWKTCTFGLTKKLPCLYSSFTKKTIELHCDLWKLFHSKWTEIIVEIHLFDFGWEMSSVVSRLQKRRNNTVNEPY